MRTFKSTTQTTLRGKTTVRVFLGFQILQVEFPSRTDAALFLLALRRRVK
jgi:hypothetical protein